MVQFSMEIERQSSMLFASSIAPISAHITKATAPAIDPLKTERLDHSSHESVVPDTVLPSAQNEAREGLER